MYMCLLDIKNLIFSFLKNYLKKLVYINFSLYLCARNLSIYIVNIWQQL